MCQPWVYLVAPSCQAQGSSQGLEKDVFLKCYCASLKTCSNNFCNAFSTNSGRKGWPGNQNEETSFSSAKSGPVFMYSFWLSVPERVSALYHIYVCWIDRTLKILGQHLQRNLVASVCQFLSSKRCVYICTCPGPNSHFMGSSSSCTT